MADGEDDDKQHEATQKKLDDARKRGEVPRSQDLTTTAAFGGVLIVGAALGARSLEALGTFLANLLARADTFSIDLFNGGGPTGIGTLLLGVSRNMAPWFAIPALAAILLTIATRSFVVAPEKLKPKLSKISPLSNAKNKFGRNGLFEFAKSFTKLLIYSVILGVFLFAKLPQIVGTLYLTPAMATATLLDLSMQFFALVCVVMLAIGGVDYLWQWQEHLRKNRMSHKELMDEVKQNEGDPHVKGQRRQKGYEIAMNQMLADVPDADVVIVNPTHYAIALRWSRLPGEAPVCVAKGVDEIAARIREVAQEAGVPIHRDPPTARAIHASVEIGQEILPEQYQAVAAAVRFAEAMRKRARAFGGHK
ncbi:EscU/YscU/HrcU family type III secretion system export apparatus switch protein [Aliiroseovarius crassostreae]|uniref:Flagellar type III secretion system protein FlhB n=1 Tax=Aliiroseovarius crassostreae TaxID=154981 RepID=A0A9Q9HD60_9RHOB|nr:flagellar type III secretion system protein FlhB [Aliiroseovarius crassostreae]UWP88768.1 flagellar type III secretion system protein FlhB [Aliiroseovarius crassostreae]UWP95077.1 flagellar type III secretion system protein FlhB [Aliiroseovarius crassostreae]UWP98236.1 flagellar type III secretion system protein FlhB [Aliiroseovarius crassostreae]UWQ01421.1 flagellar type III secretion system protein FlhB [Aliiroseovarius crassostreae]